MRQLSILLALTLLAHADERELEQPPTSIKARKLREEGKALWDGVQPVWEKVRYKKPVTQDEAVATVPVLEKAIEILEKSLEEEWNGETNKWLADASRAWYGLQPALPPPEPPTDDAAKKRAEKQAETERRARTRDIRDFIMKWGRERRADSLLRTCPKCEGRKEIRTSFGDRSPCTACSKRGRLVDREAVIEARWNRLSPLYRLQARHEQELNRLLRALAPDDTKDAFAPYLSSVSIKDVEDNGLWARVTAVDIVQPTANSPKTEKKDVTYVLFRIGPVWYAYDQQADRELLDLSEQLAPAEPAK
ncbi:MAG TPA: hypothetical protein VFY93_07220 [Planctomycetota bacterium]|nr:hypothetical protein [Planctomycetota bacterium]